MLGLHDLQECKILVWLKMATTKKRYNDTAIHGAGAGAGAGAMHKLCKLLPSITTGDISKNIFRGGAYTQKYFL